MKKHKSQVGNCDKLKAIVLHDGTGKEVHMTQPVWFATEDLVTVACTQWSSFNELQIT